MVGYGLVFVYIERYGWRGGGARPPVVILMLPEPVEHDGAVLSIVLNDVVENFKAAAVVSIEGLNERMHSRCPVHALLEPWFHRQTGCIDRLIW